MENLEIKKNSKISIKRILLIITILFLLSSTILLGYLYFSQDQGINITDSKESLDIEEDTTEKKNEREITCDFDEIIRQAEGSNFRVRFAYESILKPNANPKSPYVECKETLKAKLINILHSNSDIKNDLTKDSLELAIEKGLIAYLIDNIFVVYTYNMEIWQIDIISEDIELLWEPSKPSMLGISHLYVITENNSSRMYFLTQSSGLGGTEEEQDLIDNIIKDMCEEGNIGTFVYDTSIEAIERLYTAEECISIGL